jgi:hypothetical protein
MADVLIHPETGEELFTSWPTGKPHVSFSELSDWIQCPFRHKLLYIDKLGTFTITPHLSFGTGVHDANENYIKTRVMDKSIAYDIIRKSWIDNHELFSKGPFPWWASDGFGTVEDWINKADRIMNDVPLFLDKMFPGWTCFEAEELLYEQIENQPIFFKGFVDGILVVKDKRGRDKYIIIDWKTCGWGWTKDKQDDFDVHLQLLLYKYYWTKKHNINSRDVKAAFALLKRDGKPGNSVSLIPIQAGPTPIEKGLRIVDNHIRSVSKGFFIKNRDACKFCEFNNTVHCPPSL